MRNTKKLTKKRKSKKSNLFDKWVKSSDAKRQKKLRSLREVECACCEVFFVNGRLLRSAQAGQHDLYCPRGHEISWRGGTLAREKTLKSALPENGEQLAKAMTIIEQGMALITHRACDVNARVGRRSSGRSLAGYPSPKSSKKRR